MDERPSWRQCVTLMAAVALLTACLAGLGVWQLERAEQKRHLFGAYAAGEGAPAVTKLWADDAAAEHRFQRMELAGRYLASKQVLLEAMTHGGRAGYHVLTPFLPADGPPWILVNRGWIGAGSGRAEPPPLDVSTVPRVVRGRIDTLPAPGIRLSARAPEDATWPRVLLFPTAAEIEEIMGVPLVGYQLLLGDTEPNGFVREWRPRTLSPEAHVAYAFQWFGLAVVLVVVAASVLIAAMRAGDRAHAKTP